MCFMLFTTTRNSSPPSRAIVSCARPHAFSRSATLFQKEITHRVPERVVNVLEPVEVEKKKKKRANFAVVAASMGERLR